MKKYILLLFVPFLLIAFESEDYVKFLEDPLSEKSKIKIDNEFGYLKGKKHDSESISKEIMKELLKTVKDLPYEKAVEYINTYFKPNDYMTKEEALFLIKASYIEKYKAFNYSKTFIIYLFTSEVPRNSTANILLGISALQENGINIESKQYLTGVPDNIEKYMLDWKTFVYDLPFKYQNNIVRNFHLKFDPRFFKVYEVKQAPAMALAFCQSSIPTPKTCKIKYLIRGDTSLFNFFDKISKVEPKYEKYSNILKANGIYLPKDKKEVLEVENKK